MTLKFRDLQPDEVHRFINVFGTGLSFELSGAQVERYLKFVEIDRMRVADDQGQIVATFGAHSFRFTVPGGSVPTAGTTLVTVLPTHRRRGILRRLMEQHLAEVHAREEPLAALWASEGAIYGRFGYGIAVDRLRLRIPRAFSDLHHPLEIRGAMQLLDFDQALQVLPSVYESVVGVRPGMFTRRREWWEHRLLADLHAAALGASQRRIVYAPDGTAQAYAIYRTRRRDIELPLELIVQEVVSQNAKAEQAIWQYLFGVDLVESIDAWNVAVDHPLRWWLKDIRKVSRQLDDAVWLRTVDVPRCLTERVYSASGSLIVRVHDDLCPWNEGTFELEIGEDHRATCRPTHRSPEITCQVEAIGSVLLGGVRWSDLRNAGRADGSLEAVVKADATFTWHRQPWCPERF
jgi:predicted acetyltransferase